MAALGSVFFVLKAKTNGAKGIQTLPITNIKIPKNHCLNVSNKPTNTIILSIIE